jgi:hypothetical protein
MSVFKIDTISWVPLTKLVVRGLPLKYTTEVGRKFRPVTVSVNAAVPAVALAGERVMIAGTGLFTLKVAADDVPPPGAGLVTVTLNVPDVARSAARIAAVTCVPLTNVVARGEKLKFTTEVDTKPVPFTASVNAAPPSTAFNGEIVVIAGTGLFTVKIAADDVPLPGGGLVTVTLNVPAVAMSEARIAAETCVPLMNVVTRALPFTVTVAPLTKPVPFTVSANPGLPAVVFVGESVVIVGGSAALIVMLRLAVAVSPSESIA